LFPSTSGTRPICPAGTVAPTGPLVAGPSCSRTVSPSRTIIATGPVWPLPAARSIRKLAGPIPSRAARSIPECAARLSVGHKGT
jgi:hypothetical protein